MAVPPEILCNARRLRKRLTDAEKLLWKLLRDRQFCGFKFRRQHPVYGYIVDFYCHEEKLAIELDGGSHCSEEQRAYDVERSKEIAGAGIRVMRFWNNDVLNTPESVLETIYTVLNPSPGALHHPLPLGKGIDK